MFVDELRIEAKAGDGGDGVVRWRRERYRPKGGPAGGNGGKGGDVYLKAVRDLSLLSKYTGSKTFNAENGQSGRDRSQHGKDGDDLCIPVPVGSKVTDEVSGREYTLDVEGKMVKVLKGGIGGLGNEYFKSSTNRAPEQATEGKSGEYATLFIELSLVVDVGFIGLPNAGKSTLLNTFTNATAEIGAYPFTTLEPHLGDLFGFVLADIPGLIEGASDGKGLGHKFLRHVQKTKMLLHLVSLEHEEPQKIYQTIRNELSKFDSALAEKEEWVVFTKSDLVGSEISKQIHSDFTSHGLKTFVISAETGEGVKGLRDELLTKLRQE